MTTIAEITEIVRKLERHYVIAHHPDDGDALTTGLEAIDLAPHTTVTLIANRLVPQGQVFVIDQHRINGTHG